MLSYRVMGFLAMEGKSDLETMQSPIAVEKVKKQRVKTLEKLSLSCLKVSKGLKFEIKARLPISFLSFSFCFHYPLIILR